MRKNIKLLFAGTLLVIILALIVPISAQGALSGQIIVDPQNASWLAKNKDSNADGKPDPFFMAGPGDPEDFLYRGTRNADGTRNGDQMTLINKLKGTGANSIYLQAIRSHGGDGDSTQNPFISSNPANGLDLDILNQWETWFNEMDANNITIFFIFYDDSARIWSTGDIVDTAERSFIQAIVNRFEHHKNLIWVVAEEYQERFSVLKVKNIAKEIRTADDNDHIIAVHKLSGLSFSEFADDANIDQFAIQYNVSTAQGLHDGVLSAWKEANGRYNLNMSEAASYGTGATARKKNWAVAMAGAYVMDYEMDIASTSVSDLQDCGRLVNFMQATDFNKMAPHDELAYGGTQYVLADPGSSYIAYASSLSGSIGLRAMTAGTYDFKWFDAVNGTTVEQQNVSVASGDRTWTKPSGIGVELAVYIKKKTASSTAFKLAIIQQPTSIATTKTQKLADMNWALSNMGNTAVANGADMLVFSETAFVNYSCSYRSALSETVPSTDAAASPVFVNLSQYARNNNIWIYYGDYVKSSDPAKPYNSGIMIKPDGSLAFIYNKHYPSSSETGCGTYGGSPYVFDVGHPLGKIGSLICKDFHAGGSTAIDNLTFDFMLGIAGDDSGRTYNHYDSWMAQIITATPNKKNGGLWGNYATGGGSFFMNNAGTILEGASSGNAIVYHEYNGSTASDTTAPSVTAFSISPTTLTAGSAITASYTVTDNTALAKAELWQAPFNSTLCSDTTKTGCAWTLVNSANISGTSKSGTLTHTPSATGVFFYGLHAIDASGNIGTESSPIKVTVNAQSAVCGDNACNGTETCSTCPGDCGACTTGSSLLIDFESTHVFGLANWTTLLKDSYTKYYDLGPGGMVGGTNAAYNYQGVQGSAAKYFSQDDRIIATWYNAGTSSITFTPYVSFNDPDRRLSETAGNWHLMSSLTLSPGQTGTTQFIFDQATQGSFLLVNINSYYGSATPDLVCDKIEYKSSSSSIPGDLNSDGKVDIFDYSLFISNFGKTGTGLAADLNSDGKVDIFDYSIFISNFGK